MNLVYINKLNRCNGAEFLLFIMYRMKKILELLKFCKIYLSIDINLVYQGDINEYR